MRSSENGKNLLKMAEKGHKSGLNNCSIHRCLPDRVPDAVVMCCWGDEKDWNGNEIG